VTAAPDVILLPVMVTVFPALPDAGEIDEIEGGAL
jgi:hypothetical protein